MANSSTTSYSPTSDLPISYLLGQDFLKLAPGTVVYSAGDMSSAFYVIAFGECVREYTAEGPDVPPLALPVGAYFGEVRLLP